MKSALKSKINWVGVITVLIGGLTALQGLNLSPEASGYIMVAIGLLNVVLRSFFTSTAVSVRRVDTE